MEKIDLEKKMNKENKIKFSRFLIGQTIVLGILFAADSFFGFFEQKYIF